MAKETKPANPAKPAVQTGADVSKPVKPTVSGPLFTDDENVMSDTERSRGLKKFSMEVPFCGGEESLQLIVKSKSDDLALGFFNLVTNHYGMNFTLNATKKGGGG